MNALYNTGIYLFRLGAKAISGRNVKAAKMLAGQERTEDVLKEKIVPGRKYIWIHASSLGEFEQGRPLIERIKQSYPDTGIALTFFSPSGYEVRHNYKSADIVCYLPFDTPGRVKRFLDLLKPSMAIFVKYEFWGNYLHELKRRNIPTYLISAIFRDSQPFFKWWGGMFRGMLGCYDTIFVQDADSQRRLNGIGVTNVVVAGDTRFDRVTDILKTTVNIPAVDKLKASSTFTFIAGSSWEADEDIYIPWLNSHKEVKAIIAPHEFNDSRIAALRQRIDGPTLLMSELENASDQQISEAKALIVDCFGLLASLYRYADLAYIGGGFGEGIHNINEAAVYDIPVMFGPKHNKFKEARDLIAIGGAFEITDCDSLRSAADSFLIDREKLLACGHKAGEYIRSNIGASDKVFKCIFA